MAHGSAEPERIRASAVTDSIAQYGSDSTTAAVSDAIRARTASYAEFRSGVRPPSCSVMTNRMRIGRAGSGPSVLDVTELDPATRHERVEALLDLTVEQRLLVPLERLLPDRASRAARP